MWCRPVNFMSLTVPLVGCVRNYLVEERPPALGEGGAATRSPVRPPYERTLTDAPRRTTDRGRCWPSTAANDQGRPTRPGVACVKPAGHEARRRPPPYPARETAICSGSPSIRTGSTPAAPSYSTDVA